MKPGSHDKKATRARFLFRDRKRSCSLVVYNAAIALGSNRGCSRASTK